MTDTITAIPVSNKVPDGSIISTKPAHLVSVAMSGGKIKKMFIALERPVLEISHIQTKGFFVENTEENILENWTEIVKNTDKALHTEMYFPWHSVIYIRNLVYNANKSK